MLSPLLLLLLPLASLADIDDPRWSSSCTGYWREKELDYNVAGTTVSPSTNCSPC